LGGGGRDRERGRERERERERETMRGNSVHTSGYCAQSGDRPCITLRGWDCTHPTVHKRVIKRTQLLEATVNSGEGDVFSCVYVYTYI